MHTLGIDVGSTYTKAVLHSPQRGAVAHAMEATGSKLVEVAERVGQTAAGEAGLTLEQVDYVVTTGYGRHLIPFRDLQVTDLTAASHGSLRLFPGTRTVLDIGGQTMKASRIDASGRVATFRLNDKCAAGTGAFLEKTARYMGYTTEGIGDLLESARHPVSISGVCAVFAESEVISHLSEGVPAEDIMLGAVRSLTARSVQLMRRIKAEPEYTLIGGILRWPLLARVVSEELDNSVNVPAGEMPQYTAALGAAVLGQVRLRKLAQRSQSSAGDRTRRERVELATSGRS